MNSNPKISIFASANRPQNWLDLYESVGENYVEFEIVFVGPVEPNFLLPDNLHFIKSLVKPAQCAEIAFRNTRGDLVMNIADDCFFVTKNPLDNLYECYKNHGNDELIVSCRYVLNGQDQSDKAHRFCVDSVNSPLVPLGGLMSSKLFRDLGGIDRNFIAVMWDLDIAMRVHALKGTVILSDVYLDEEKSRGAGSTLCSDWWNHDRLLLESLWTNSREVHLERAKPVETFSDYRIMEVSQGPRGRWRGNGPILIEKIQDEYWKLVRNSHYLKSNAIHFIGETFPFLRKLKKRMSRLSG
jgi:hypothetical protein